MPHISICKLFFLVGAIFSASCATVNTTDTVVAGNEIIVDFEEKSYESYYNFSLAKLALYDKDLAKAIEHMEIAEKLEPNSAYLKYNLALLYIATNLNTDAKEKLKRSIELDPDYLESYKLLGRLLSTSTDPGDKKQAEKYLKKAIKIDPEDSNSYFLLALYYIGEGDYSKSKKLLRKTIKLKPYDENALLFLGELLREEENLEDAKFIYTELYDLNPKNFATILALASIEEKLGKFNRAEEYYSVLIDFYPNNPRAYEQFGNYLYRVKKYDDALNQFLNAEIIDLNNPDVK
ncbi:MAG: tetratricopeptide repeat protein, partial [Thermodesulfobacteriota bacterium]